MESFLSVLLGEAFVVWEALVTPPGPGAGTSGFGKVGQKTWNWEEAAAGSGFGVGEPGMAECSGTVTTMVSALQVMCTHQQLHDKQNHPTSL